MSTRSMRVHVVHPDSPSKLLLRVFRLRYRVYVEEMGMPVGGDPVQGLRDPADDTAVSFLCEVDGEDVGTLRFVGSRDRTIELFEQSSEWESMILATSASSESYFEVNRFMVLRQARGSDVAIRLVNAAFRHATANRYREGFIAAKQGRLLKYYQRFYRGRQLTESTTPYLLNGHVLGHYHLMRFDLGHRWSPRRWRLAVYYRALALCAAYVHPLVGLAVGKRSGFSVDAVPQEISQAPSRPLLGG